MKRLVLFIVLFQLLTLSFAQEIKQVRALRVMQVPKIDGVLDDEAWKEGVNATDFIQRALKPGEPALRKTEVKIVYDDIAMYVGAMMYDNKPDSILCELCQRDNEANSDLFGLILDTYNDDINGYGFFVTSAGVQIDARYSSNGQDFNWNAVWQSQIKINDKGWAVEFKIPYSALRFPIVAEQNWGVNFIRKVRKTRCVDFWNEVKPEVSGMINQSGDLLGISNIKSPVRLSVTPYVSSYIENYPYDQPGQSNNSYSLNGGMDIKYGINESFTMDMTLVPDFGQVQSDNKVLNLSPFEVLYNENRQFFTEGTELFNKGGLFYSRRIGGTPINYNLQLKEGEIIKSNPASTQLINATKVSGRTKNNLGIGIFNATTADTYATITDSNGVDTKVLTQPLTNYNVFVLDQALKNNSYISLINTNVTRDGGIYDANVTATAFKFTNKKNKYGVNGNAALSQLYYSGLSKPDLGYAYNASVGKISGGFLYNADVAVKSDKYDPNDLAILYINNTVETSLNWSYNIYKPVWKLNEYSIDGGVGYSRLFKPDLFWNLTFYGNGYANFSKSYFSTGAGFNFSPLTTLDHWEPRIAGHYYVYPKNYNLSYWISTDYRKRFALDANISYRYFDENNRYNISFGVAPRYRVNNKLSFIYNFHRDYLNDNIGFVNFNETTQFINFGRRNVFTTTNQLNATYIFTNKMSLTLRCRHYWSQAQYKQYYTLNNKGLLIDDALYTGNSNVNFNAFNIDLVYTWQFSRGSEMSFVWKNAIYTSGDVIVKQFTNDIDQTINSPQTNSFSIKVLYYLDYSMLQRKKSIK
ncbi:MAG: DUF5916 domain-containing protein [Bacteroidota bacterium]